MPVDVIIYLQARTQPLSRDRDRADDKNLADDPEIAWLNRGVQNKQQKVNGLVGGVAGSRSKSDIRGQASSILNLQKKVGESKK